MKKFIVIIIQVVLFVSFSRAQDSVYVKKKISETDIDALFSLYTQDGNHSAVTGGTGTENLQVYAPAVNVSHTIDSTHTIIFNAGIDFITSASTDRIDYNMSSASYKDSHFQVEAGYSQYFRKPRMQVGLTGRAALESDFLSEGFHLWMQHSGKSGMNGYYAGFSAYFDDLRWGRLNPDYKRPVTLVYPGELRDTNWFNIYMRYSYNLDLGYERVINKKMVIGFYPGLQVQTGLLSTPFHRVYFAGNDSARVENLPRKRIKFPLGIRFNSFIGNKIILNTFYRFYDDDFGILSNTLELETHYKVTPEIAPSVSFRIYRQSAAKYFRPYREHVYTDTYYTSDYDLSRFYSLEAGIGLRYAPFKRIFGKFSFDEIELKYNYYWRSDGLHAHFLSTYFGFAAGH